MKRVDKKNKGKGGRHSKYDPQDTPMWAEKYARQGLSDKQIMHNLGISEFTFYTWQHKHPKFHRALKRGKAPIDFEVENAMLKRARGYTYNEIHRQYDKDGNVVSEKVIRKEVAPDVTAQIFWSKNRQPERWKDSQQIDHTTRGDKLKITVEDVRNNGESKGEQGLSLDQGSIPARLPNSNS